MQTLEELITNLRTDMKASQGHLEKSLEKLTQEIGYHAVRQRALADGWREPLMALQTEFESLEGPTLAAIRNESKSFGADIAQL